MTNKELEKEIKELRALVENFLTTKVPVSFSLGKKEMNSCEWEEIIDICDKGLNTSVFERDDYKEIELKSGEIVQARILGANHDVMENGETASATLFFTIDGEYEMNVESTNEGGWESSKMKNTYMQRIYNLLPDDLKKYIVPVYKTTSIGGGSEELERELNSLFLLSEVEYSNTTEYSAEGEGEQYAYFKNGGELPKKWNWLRSPFPGLTNYFSYVYNGGGGNYNYAFYTFGVCPCFAISNQKISHD